MPLRSLLLLLALVAPGLAFGQGTMRGGGVTMSGGRFTTNVKKDDTAMGVVRDSNRAISEIGLDVEGGSTQSNHDPTGSPAFDAALHGTLFFRRVLDDGTPRGLQPYLQRAGGLTLATNVGIATGPFTNIPGDDTRSFHHVGIAGAVDAYLSRFLAIAVAGSYAVVDASVAERLLARLRGSLGLRFGTLRVDLGGEVVYNHERGRSFVGEAGTPVTLSPNHADGRGRLDLHVVLLEHIELRLGGSAGSDGGDGYFIATYHAGSRLAMGWGGGAGARLDPRHAHDSTQLWLRVNIGYWITRSWSVTLQFTPTWDRSDLGGSFDQRVTISLAARIG